MSFQQYALRVVPVIKCARHHRSRVNVWDPAEAPVAMVGTRWHHCSLFIGTVMKNRPKACVSYILYVEMHA